jgi:hydrogenase maturation factor
MADADIIGTRSGKEDGRGIGDLCGRYGQGAAQDANGQECQYGTCSISEPRIPDAELDRIRKEVHEELSRTVGIDIVTGGFP